MSYHIVNIDSPQADISCRKGQLSCRVDGVERQLPLEDVAAIVITSFSARIHSHLLLEAAKNGVALIICEDFKPVSLMLPANRSSDTLLTKAALSIEKRQVETLWRKTIDAKCHNQWVCAQALNPAAVNLKRLEKTAEGRSQHKESTCSRLYWDIYRETLADSSFNRKRDAGGLNDLLNYGYAVLLSTVLQKLFAVGLDPTLGIGHEIRERSSPLAYDLMEPFRPCVDWRVAAWVLQQAEFHDYRITGAFRRYITGFTVEKVGYFGLELSIQNCIESVVRSFRKAVLHKEVRHYKPWTQKNLRWDG
ncbi:MAG: type II CRISPR-associated endonuclease Cas1 [Opitutales bacterium]|nr:type II CRISPR-associated endonuclease Cas1 [Opitutales bacterium]